LTVALKSRLADGAMLIGTFLKTPSPIICEVLGQTELDLICIDAEHAPFDRGDIDACIHALRAADMPCLVRVPANRPEHILTALDCGANGILAPHIATANAAEKLVEDSQYGRGRGFAGSSRAAGYTSKSMAQHKTDSNANVVTVAQIEDVDALDHLEELFAVDGVDCFFVGRADLTISMGLDDSNHPTVIEAVTKICEKGTQAGRRIGMFVANYDEIRSWQRMGVSLFILSSDHVFLKQGAAKLCHDVRSSLS